MTTAFELVINGRFLSQRMTGVQRVSREFVHALDRAMVAGQHPGLAVRLLAQADAADPGLRAISLERIGRARGHRWEQFTLPRHVGSADALLCLGNSAPVLSLLGRRPVAVMLHDLAYRLFPQDYSPAYRLFHRVVDTVLLQRARPLVTVSGAERAVIARLHPAAAPRLMVAANGGWAGDAPPAATWSPRAGRDAYVLYVGALSDRKNGAGLVQAAIDLAGAGIGFRFAGPPPADAPAIPEALRPLIRFCGYVGDDALRGLYAGASLFLFPSFYEASGLPPVEAMTIGCPVVVSDIPVMRERCGDAAVYCDPHDRGSILDAALSLVEQPALAREMSRRGRRQAATFTWEKQVDRVIGAIASELRHDRRGAVSASQPQDMA